jgi:copper transport protein
MRQTRFGSVWIASAPILLVLVGAAWIPGRSRRRAGLIASIAAILLALRTLASHAIDFGAAATVLYFVHEAAAGLWGGALMGLWFTARSDDIEAPQAALIIRRVSRLAGWCVAGLVISGIYIGYCALGLNLDHLLYSAYGRTLVAKVTVFAIVAATGGYNRYWLVPRVNAASVRGELIESVQIECILMLAVLALAVLLANTPPAH